MTSSRPGRRYGADHETLGGKVGPKIAKLVAEAVSTHLRESASTRADIGLHAALRFFKTIEAERNTHAADLLSLLLGHEKTHPAMERVLRFAHGGSGELSSLLSTHMVGGAIAGGIGSGIANILAPANQAIMYADPANILEPATMAQLAAARIVSDGYAQHISQMSGIPPEATQYLIDANYSWPGLAELLELMRRGEIDGQEAVKALERSGVPSQFIGPLLGLRVEHLSPADGALAVLRGIITEAEGQEIGKLNGLGANDFDILVANTGEPPGLMQLLEAYRREIIDDERLRKGIRQSRVRTEWTDVVEALRFERASPSDALRGVVQGHLTSDEGKRIAEMGGLSPDDWDWLVATEGNPAAPMQMIELWRRGKVGPHRVEEAIREGRIKNKYIPELLNLKRAIPSIYQIKSMLEAGTIAEQEGARLMHELGYETDLVAGFVHAAAGKKVTKEKLLAKSEITELYYDGAITEARASQLLVSIGYTSQDAEYILILVDLKREKTLRQAAMGAIKTQYVDRRLTRSEASARLDELGIPHTQRDYALVLWEVDRQATTKRLSEAQVVKANEQELLTDHEAEEHLLALGYSLGDARILLDLEKDRRRPAP